ncbi:MAG: RibD family protein [Pseudomonadota bacterium]
MSKDPIEPEPRGGMPLPEDARAWAAEIGAHRGTGASFVVAQLGQSLDGRIATETGDSRWINGAGALDYLHLIRANVDAVVVGAGTIAADDPRLTVRRVDGKSPARVVIDPNGRTDLAAKWRAPDGARRLVVRGSAPASCGDAEPRQPDGAEIIHVDAVDSTLAPGAIVAALGKAGLHVLLIEGGATTISQFVDAGVVDRLALLVGPVVIGSGKPGLSLAPVGKLSEARRPVVRTADLGGGDVLFDCAFTRAQGSPAQ